MSGREQRQTGSQTRPENADARIALLRKPADRTTCVEHRLPVGVQRPADVGTDDELGARKVRRPPFIVIGQTQPHGRETKTREQLAQAYVAAAVGVPLRQHEDGTAWSRR